MTPGNILKIGKLYITTDRCHFFNVAHSKNGAWVDVAEATPEGNWFSEVEVPPGTSVLILSTNPFRTCFVALVGEQTLFVFYDDVDVL